MLSKIATRGGFGLAAVTLAVCFQPHAASASKLTTLFSFCAEQDCADGNGPFAPLTIDAAGDLFGTTFGGGSTQSGVIFKLERRDGGGYVYRVLDNLCADTVNCSDGGGVTEKLVVDVNGDVYAAASKGGAFGHGVVFKLSPTRHGLYKNTALYSFCDDGNCATSGDMPVGGLAYQGIQTGALYDGRSPLFGVTSEGGTENGGVAYQLTFGGKKKSPAFSVLYNFCSLFACADGLFPDIGLTPDADGNLFGATHDGGRNEDGIAFELSPAQGAYTQTVLHDFCTGDCSDGSDVPEAMMPGPGGSLIDYTGGGGAHGDGTVFKLSPKNGGKWKYSILYAFCAQPSCADGKLPRGTVAVGASGTIFGATNSGGAGDGEGTVFKLSGRKYSVLYSFCTQTNCADGDFPDGGVILDGGGNLFGTTLLGGANGEGTIFELTP